MWTPDFCSQQQACMSDLCGIFLSQTPKMENRQRDFQKTPLGYSELRLSITQSNLTVHYDMPSFPTGIMKVSLVLAQREAECIFHRHSPFIIHDNHLKV